MKLFRIFISILIVFLFIGCIDTLLDDISPSIFFDNVNSVNGEYTKVYSGQNVTIKGRVEDNDVIDYLKNDGVGVKLNNGNFELVIPNTKTETVFEVKDKAGNKKSIKVKLSLDEEVPLFIEILLNDFNYTENMVIGDITELEIAVKANDINGIDRVKIGDDTLISGEGEYFRYVYNKTLINGLNTVDIDVWDSANNWNSKTISFYYDKKAPEISKIEIEDEEISLSGDIFYIGKASFKMKIEFTDISNSINVNSLKINGNDLIGIVSGKTILVDPVVITSDSSLTMIVDDEYGNRLTKTINLKYRDEEPVIENLSLSIASSGDSIAESDGIYYTNEATVLLSGAVDAANGDGLYLKSFKINGEAFTVNNQGEFTKTILLDLEQGENIIELEIMNNANSKTVEIFRVYYDTKAPEITFTNLLKDDLIVNNYFSFRRSTLNSITIEGIMNESKLKDFYINETAVVVDANGKFLFNKNISGLSKIIYKAEDYSGNINEGTINLVTDDQKPSYKVGTIKINGEIYYENIIVEPIDEDMTIEIELEGIDNNGINKVSLSGKDFIRKENDLFEISYSGINPGINIHNLIIEDYAGNTNSNTNIRFRYYNGDPDINEVKLNGKSINETDTYYVSESSAKLEFNAVSGDSEMNMDLLRIKVNDSIVFTESGDDGIKTIENLYLDLKDEMKTIEIYLKNESGKEVSKSYKVYYDAKIPTISNMKVSYTSFGKKLSETNYIQNMAYPYPEESRQADTILLSFNLEDDKGLDESFLKLIFLDESELKKIQKDGNLYTFEIERKKIYQGLNRIDLVALDIAGNLFTKAVYINFYKLYPIEIDEALENELETDSIRVRWKDVQFRDEILLKYELYMKEEGQSNYILQATDIFNNNVKVSGLKDNQKYEFYVLVYDKYYNSPNNTMESGHKEIRTNNRQPETVKIKLESVNKKIDAIRDYGIKISWEKLASKDEHDFTAYSIYRNDKETDNQSDYIKIADIKNVNEIFYSDTAEALKENKLIKYKLAILDKGGMISDFSNELKLYSYNLPPDVKNSTFDFRFQDEISGRFGIKDDNNKIKLSFKFKDIKDEIHDLDRYEVYRSRDYDLINTEEIKPSILIYSGYLSGTTLQNTYPINGVKASLEGSDIIISETGLKENRKYYYSIRIYDTDRDLYDNVNSVYIGDISEYEETDIKEVITKDLSL